MDLKHGWPTHDFTPGRPNEKWLTDITDHPTSEGKLYLCAVKVCYANKIVGYSIDSRMKSSLAASALRNAIALRSPAGTIAHGDRGGEYTSHQLERELRRHGALASMGKVADCFDSALAESVFATLECELFGCRSHLTGGGRPLRSAESG